MNSETFSLGAVLSATCTGWFFPVLPDFTKSVVS